MAFLSIDQVQKIKEHMIENDQKTLNSKYKSKNTPYNHMTVDLNEVENYEKEGWEVITTMARTAKMQKEKDCGTYLEDRIWCLFYNLGFRTLNYDNNLEVQWGTNKEDHHQLDVVAVDDEAIFVVECKATKSIKNNVSFRKDIDAICQYKDGVTKALRQIYGDTKKVKFIFATDNFRFSDNSEDLQRLANNNIFHFNEQSYSYIKSLIKSYKSSVKYQFFGLMFKNELINSERIRIPALKGTMGGHDYYMLSIEPSILLKIGFVVHRTRGNEKVTPTYQRLLIPSRLKGITDFIDKEKGYFPNSVIINFDSAQRKLKVQFEVAGKTEDTNSRFGYLSIPNAYGIAYIIDGQHRVYGYAGSKYKDSNTIPVVAFVNMEPKEQLKMFMDINEHQKAVKPSLRLDLNEDLNWDSERLDSRLSALRSSIIKVLTRDQRSVLFSKISVGEDSAKLTFKPFNEALKRSGLVPNAVYNTFSGETDVCLYDTKNTSAVPSEREKVLNNAKDRISSLLIEAYGYVHSKVDDKIFDGFLVDNRGTYAFIILIGALNRYLITQKGKLTQQSSTDEQIMEMSTYLDVLVDYLKNIPEEHRNRLFIVKGQGADTTWLRMFENCINEKYSDFQPEGLMLWKESQDNNLQQEGQRYGKHIEQILHDRILSKLQDLHGEKWERAVFEIKAKCLSRMSSNSPDESDIDENDWPDYLQASDYKDIIEKNWNLTKEDDETYVTFEKDFSIRLSDSDPFKSHKDKLKWLSDLISYRNSWTSTKPKPLTRGQVEELHSILEILNQSE